MSRKAIIEFRKVANSQTLDVDKFFFDNIIPIYEDSVHTPQERAKILEKDILWLLNDMVQADKAIDRSNPDRQQRIPFFNYRNLLQSLILSTADKGIYLSESFVKAYENVDMGAYSFGEFVRNAYKPAWWEVQPQQKPTATPQQPIGGNSGELAGNGNGTPPEGNEKPVIKKDDLPTIYNDGNKDREQQVFYNAIQNKLMVLNDDGKGYTWKTNNKLLCLMCAILYWNDEIEKSEVRIDAYNTQFVYTLKKNNIYFEDATRLKEMFGGKDISNYRSKLKELPEDWDRIDKLF